MKALTKLTVLSTLFLGACSSTYQAHVYDDVYYSPKHKTDQAVPQAQPKQFSSVYDNTVSSQKPKEGTQVVADEEIYDNDQAAGQTGQYTNPDGTANITNNYNGDYNYDDYYDYNYSSRLRRFHSGYYFDDYYNDWYTNYYWYNHDPFYWGSSIYLSYGWMWPHSYFSFGWDPWYGWNYGYGMGWGYPYNSWYNPYYYPYWGWGYDNGWCYWNGYYGGDWGYYFNSHDPNTYYYGPRKPRTGGNHSGGSGTGRSDRGTDMTFGDRYMDAVKLDNNLPSGKVADTRVITKSNNDVKAVQPNPTGKANVNPSEQAGSNVAKTQETPNKQGEIRTIRPFAQPKKAQTQRSSSESPVLQNTTPQGRSETAQKSARPQNNQSGQSSEQRYSKPRTYASPNYTQPKSSQEYTSPKTDRTPEQRVSSEPVNPNNNRSQNQQRGYSSPQRTQREYTPSSTPSYTPESSPQRSQSTPSYSPPSRSSSGSSSGGGGRSSGSSGSGSGKRR